MDFILTLFLLAAMNAWVLGHVTALGHLPAFQQSVSPSTTETGAYFGSRVAMNPSGTRAVIAEPHYVFSPELPRSSNGSAKIYDRIDITWTQTASLQFKDPGSLYQGRAVGISQDGNTVVTADPTTDQGRGAVFIFQKTGGVWDSGVKLTEQDPEEDAYFGLGAVVSLDGNTMAAGRISDTGGAVVFHRTGATQWQQQGPRLPLNVAHNFSLSSMHLTISADGGLLAMGVPYDLIDDLTGSFYFFKRNTSMLWTQSSKVTLSGAFLFGYTLSMSADGKVLLVGARPGAYVYVLNGDASTYVLWQSMSASGASFFFGGGGSISPDASRIVVSDRFANPILLNAGTTQEYTYYKGGAFIFDRQGPATAPYYVNVPGDLTIPSVSSMGETFDYESGFGYAVAVSNQHHILIGAPFTLVFSG